MTISGTQLYPFHDPHIKKIWACLLTNESYLRGVLTLYYSLIKSKTKYPFYVMYTETLGQRALDVLAERNISVLQIPLLKPATTYSVTESRFNETWSKINIYALDQFDRIAVLDGDMLILQNMDELMEIPVPDDVLAACHACVCNPRKLSHYPPTWIPSACAYTYQLHPASVVEGMPVSFPNGLSELNGGLQIFKPSREKFERVFAVLNTSGPEEFFFADQSLLSKTFHGKWIPLPFIYNALKTLRTAHAPIWKDEDVKNVHYILRKPWDDEARVNDEEPTHVWWWGVDQERQIKEKEAGLSEPEWIHNRYT